MEEFVEVLLDNIKQLISHATKSWPRSWFVVFRDDLIDWLETL